MEDDSQLSQRGDAENISIHVPRVEDDCGAVDLRLTHPRISIHVPRVEDDYLHMTSQALRADFNPRPPCGGRLSTLGGGLEVDEFQSTSPVWRTTVE